MDIGYLLISWSEPQHAGTEQGGNKYAHTFAVLLSVSNSRIEESPTPLKKSGTEAQTVCQCETDYVKSELFAFAHRLRLFLCQRSPKSQLLWPRVRPPRPLLSAVIQLSLDLALELGRARRIARHTNTVFANG